MNNMENLYRQVIMDHYKNPRNKGLVQDPEYKTVHIKNPTCGDDITIQSKVKDGKVVDVKHDGTGCSICCSSASVMSETLIGKSKKEAMNITETYLNMLSNKEFDENVELEDAVVYSGVKKFPARIKCASIAWKAFEGTIEESEWFTMSEKTKQEINNIIGDYKYGFKTETKSVMDTGKGLSLDIVKEISKVKGEPEWMLDFRIKSYEAFLKKPQPTWGPDLSEINFDEITYYIKPSEKSEDSWEDVPEEIKDTFEKLGIPEAEQKFLAGVSTQFESEVVYHSTIKELEDLGVIFTDTDTALREHPELFKEYFGKIVPARDNKYAALNSSVWSGGSFIYVPKGVHVEKPLQSYFRINSEQMGQFERTLIIVDEGASVNYVEGCTAPVYTKHSLHAAIVEIFVKKGGYCRYSTVQNWANNIINLVTKRALVEEDGHMEWIDGNIGSKINMKYPACILKGDRAKGTTISIAFAGEGMNQDTGAKMIHIGKDTTSKIISKSMSAKGGRVNYRGLIQHNKSAIGAKSNVECDTIILDDISVSDTLPYNIVKNNQAQVQHEATVSKVSEEQLFYLMSRGLTEEQATEMIIMGFIEPFAKELPMEYAVELNQLIHLEMEGSIG